MQRLRKLGQLLSVYLISSSSFSNTYRYEIELPCIYGCHEKQEHLTHNLKSELVRSCVPCTLQLPMCLISHYPSSDSVLSVRNLTALQFRQWPSSAIISQDSAPVTSQVCQDWLKGSSLSPRARLPHWIVRPTHQSTPPIRGTNRDPMQTHMGCAGTFVHSSVLNRAWEVNEIQGKANESLTVFQSEPEAQGSAQVFKKNTL